VEGTQATKRLWLNFSTARYATTSRILTSDVPRKTSRNKLLRETRLLQKGFWPGGQTTLIQDEEQTRKIDSRIHAPGFVRFNSQFHIPNAVTFSTVSTRRRR